MSCRALYVFVAVLFVVLSTNAVVAGLHPDQTSNAGQQCVACHTTVTPNVVSDWKLSKHHEAGIECDTCHGTDHMTEADAAKAKIPTPDTCGQCHETQVAQFKKGKHSMAWAAMEAMPTIHWQPMAMTEGMKGCGSCHKIGIKTPEQLAALQKQERFGTASCDSCHTRHTFSLQEARSPQACETCHMGFDHPQWEMYSSSKHGVRNELKQLMIQSGNSAAPTCQKLRVAKVANRMYISPQTPYVKSKSLAIAARLPSILVRFLNHWITRHLKGCGVGCSA